MRPLSRVEVRSPKWLQISAHLEPHAVPLRRLNSLERTPLVRLAIGTLFFLAAWYFAIGEVNHARPA